MSDIDAIVRAAGVQLAETVAAPAAVGTRTRYGTVKAVGACTLDVELAGGTVSGVPMTTACFGAQVGDRVMLAVDGPLVTATGILANSDNGPYVRSGIKRFGAFTPGYGGTYTIDTGLAGNVAAVVGNASTGKGWTWARFALAEISGGTIKVNAYNDGTSIIPDGAFSWVAARLR